MLQRPRFRLLGYEELELVDLRKEQINYSYYRCRRLFAEFLMVLYNDILNVADYKHALNIYLKTKNKFYRNKLDKHYSSIQWLMEDSIGSICFEVLELNHLTQQDVINSILKKFNSPTRYTKFYSCCAKEDYEYELVRDDRVYADSES